MRKGRAPVGNGAANGSANGGISGPANGGNVSRPRPSQRPSHRHGPVRPRGSLIAAIDIGTTKTCCFIGRVEDQPRILGIGHQIARGVKRATIIDLDAAADSIRNAVHAAEEMAGETIGRAVVNLSGGHTASRIVKAEIGVGRHEITDRDMRLPDRVVLRVNAAPANQAAPIKKTRTAGRST